MLISRRQALLGGGAILAAAPRPAIAGNPGGVRVGAIRWDVWYGATTPGTTEFQACHNLDPADYQYRAPFFASKIGPDQMYINGQQADMDAEIIYAANAGLKYWMFDWYASNRPLRNSWNYYQASANKALINWCLQVGTTGFVAGLLPTVSELVGYFQQATYEKYGSRPLLYLLEDGAPAASLTAPISALRTACTNAGVASPYVTLMNGTPATAAAHAITAGADCISAYAHAAAGPLSYPSYDANVQSFWATMIAQGKDVIPIGMTGWDLRPRIQKPILTLVRPWLGMTNFITPGTAAQIATHIMALVAFVTANPATCPSNKAIVYSWSELDEGGNGLIPTWTASGPDNSRLTALAGVLQ